MRGKLRADLWGRIGDLKASHRSSGEKRRKLWKKKVIVSVLAGAGRVRRGQKGAGPEKGGRDEREKRPAVSTPVKPKDKKLGVKVIHPGNLKGREQRIGSTNLKHD